MQRLHPYDPATAAREDSREAVSGQHRVLGILVDAVARTARISHIEAWWSVLYIADHVAGLLSVDEWLTLAATARRQADHAAHHAKATAPPGWKA
jgi:hypothetical protein